MKIEWVLCAEKDIQGIINYIQQDNLIAAIEQVDEIYNQIDLLRSHPMMGRIGRVTKTRELVISRTPYIVIYQIREKQIFILRVLHGAQEWSR